MLLRMARDPEERRRRLRDGREFMRYLSRRSDGCEAGCACAVRERAEDSVAA